MNLNGDIKKRAQLDSNLPNFYVNSKTNKPFRSQRELLQFARELIKAAIRRKNKEISESKWNEVKEKTQSMHCTYVNLDQMLNYMHTGDHFRFGPIYIQRTANKTLLSFSLSLLSCDFEFGCCESIFFLFVTHHRVQLNWSHLWQHGNHAVSHSNWIMMMNAILWTSLWVNRT